MVVDTTTLALDGTFSPVVFGPWPLWSHGHSSPIHTHAAAFRTLQRHTRFSISVNWVLNSRRVKSTSVFVLCTSLLRSSRRLRVHWSTDARMPSIWLLTYSSNLDWADRIAIITAVTSCFECMGAVTSSSPAFSSALSLYWLASASFWLAPIFL
jgi:hypothetical protein